MASSVMMRHLPQLLLPQRLASITSVEMVWNKYPSRSDVPNSLDSFGLPAMYSLMDVLESTMPHLRQLSITLDCDITLEHWKEDNTQGENKPTISTPIDDMVRRIRPRLEECDISIPYHIFEQRKNRAEETSMVWDVKRRSDDGRFWRELPCTDMGNEALAMNLRGYWVCCGERDYRLYPFPCWI